MAKKESKAASPPRNTIHSFFRPTTPHQPDLTTPSALSKRAPSSTPKPVLLSTTGGSEGPRKRRAIESQPQVGTPLTGAEKRGNRKAQPKAQKVLEVVVLDDDDDSDDSEIEIVELELGLIPKPSRKRSGTATSGKVGERGKDDEELGKDGARGITGGEDNAKPGLRDASKDLGRDKRSEVEIEHDIACEKGARDDDWEEGEAEAIKADDDWGDDEAIEMDGEEGGPSGGGEEEWGEEQDDAQGEEMEIPLKEEADGLDENGMVQGCSKDLGGGPSSCPICSVDVSTISLKERSFHINKCKDSDSRSGFFAPISNLFRSANDAVKAEPDIKPKRELDTKPALDGKKTPFDEKPRKPLYFLPTFSLPTKSNAFTTLMGGHAETKQWQAAEAADKQKGRMPKGEARSVPFYKWIEGMEITVDAFKYNKIDGCKAYFLSHAHSDHYQNLSSSWSHGPIYASLTTANLIKLKLGVKDEYLHVLPMNETVTVHGIDVTLIDANHCPGSVLFLFSGPHTDPKSPHSKNPKRIFHYLHCGDFRASPEHILHPAMKGKRIDIVYLDTTYLSPTYVFPAQELVIEAAAELIRARVSGDQTALDRREEDEGGRKIMKGWLKDGVKKEEPGLELVGVVGGRERKKERLLVYVGTYSIGKERLVKGIARALGPNTKVYGDDRKRAILDAQDDPELHAMLTENPLEAQIHLGWLSEINRDGLSDVLTKYAKAENAFTKIVGLRPTGWTFKSEAGRSKTPTIAKVLELESRRRFSPAGMYPQRDSSSTCAAYGVPYSEHSSFFELTCFALSLDYLRIVPTVNVATPASRAKMADWQNRWMQEKKAREKNKVPRMVPHRAATYW